MTTSTVMIVLLHFIHFLDVIHFDFFYQFDPSITVSKVAFSDD